MKRYILFSGYQYYPAGGMNDFTDSFDTIEKAKSYINDSFECDWCHLFDTIERKLVDIDN